MDTLLETPRLILRKYAPADLDLLYEFTRDKKAMIYVGDGKPLTLERTQKFINSAIANFKRIGYGCLAVIEKTSGNLIGNAGVVFPQPNVHELIYGFRQSAWGKGYGFEAANAIVECCRSRWKIPKLVVTVDTNHMVSMKILKKLKFQKTEERVDEHSLPESVYELVLNQKPTPQA